MGRNHADLFQKLMLLLRYQPPSVKVIGRPNIPKFPRGSRPLSLMNDVFAFSTAIVSDCLLNGLIKAEEVLDETVAYMKGKGCDDITLLNLAMKEDAIASKRPCAFDNADEEKFFDRCGPDLQCAALLHAGSPKQGYVEWTACGMENCKAHLITRRFFLMLQYLHGLLQGSKLSVVLSNQIIRLKFEAWRMIKDADTGEWTLAEPNDARLPYYQLSKVDPADEAKGYGKIRSNGYMLTTTTPLLV